MLRFHVLCLFWRAPVARGLCREIAKPGPPDRLAPIAAGNFRRAPLDPLILRRVYV